jgi:hypothetical protein
MKYPLRVERLLIQSAFWLTCTCTCTGFAAWAVFRWIYDV